MDARIQLDTARGAWRRMGDELVVLDLKMSSYLSVNAAGTTLWPLLESGTTRAEMITALRDEFAIDETTAATDVDTFVSHLDHRGFLLDQ